MSNRSSCRVLRTLGMDGFLGFKCGPSCSEKQHNKEIKALIDAIDDLLAYDSKTKEELGADVPIVVFGDDANTSLLGKLDDINNKTNDLRSTHNFEPFGSSDQSESLACDAALRGLGATVDSAKERFRVLTDDPDGLWGLREEDREKFQSYKYGLVSSHSYPSPGGLA